MKNEPSAKPEAQEPSDWVKPTEEQFDDEIDFSCGECGYLVGRQTPIFGPAFQYRYCPMCGKRIKWAGEKEEERQWETK